MDKNKMIIILCIVILIIVVTLIIILNKNKDNYPIKEAPLDPIPVEAQQALDEQKGKVRYITKMEEYSIVDSTLSKFYDNLKAYYDEYNVPSDEDKEYYSNKMLNLLGKEYVEYSNITTSNVAEKFGYINNPSFQYYNGYYVDNYDNYIVIYVEGKVFGTGKTEPKEFKCIATMNRKNQAVALYFNEYVDSLNMTWNIDEEINIPFDTAINANDDNIYYPKTITTSDYAEDLFNSVRNMLLKDTQKAYELLDDSMKSEYPTYESFVNFINDNKKDISLMYFGNYAFKTYDGKNAYSCADNKDLFNITVITDSLVKYTYRITKY